MRQFNTKLFLWLLGIAVTVAAGTFVAHWLQTGRIARALLWQARHAEEEGRPEQTVRYLGRYLEFSPNDIEERAHLGRVLADRVLVSEPSTVTYKSRERALFVLEQVVAQAPEKQDLRRLLVRVAMELRRFDLAQEHLAKLNEAAPAEGATELLLGQCHEGQEHYAEAALWYARAIEHAPQQRDSYVRLAALLRRPDHAQWPTKDKEAKAVLAQQPEQVLDLLVSRNDADFHAHLDRWNNRRPEDLQDPKKLAAAAVDVQRALRLAPEDGEVLLAASDLARSEKNFGEARAYLKKACALHPKEKRLYLALANVELVDGNKWSEAIAALQQGLSALPEQQDLLWLLANVLIDSKQPEAGKVVERLGKTKVSPTGIDYLHARLLLNEGRWVEAAKLLENALPVMERDGANVSLLNQVDLYLAGCYEQLDEPARQREVYNRLIQREERHDPASPILTQAYQGKAAALAALGELDSAVSQYRQLLTRKDAPAAAANEVARLLMERNLGRDQRNWNEVQQELDRARAAQPDSLDAVVLQARVFVFQQQYDKARQELEAARTKFPKRIEPWTALAELAELRKAPDEAKRLLADAERQLGDSPDLRLARARYWSARPKEEAKNAEAALRELAEGLDKVTHSPQELTRLVRGLVEANFRAGFKEQALQLWGRVACMPEYAHDLRIKQVQFDLALQAGNDAVLDQVLADIQRIEGGRGPSTNYGEALRLIQQAKDKKEPVGEKLDRAAALLETAATQRTSWSAVPQAQAEVAKLKNDPGQAIVYYQKAIEKGERNNLTVLRQLAQLLDQRGRTAEADKLLQQVPTQALIDADAQWLAADISLRSQQDPGRAAQIALAAVRKESQDYRDYLRLGQVLAVNQRWPEAEQNLRKAVALAGDQVDPRVALVQFLAATGQRDQAVKATAEAEQALPVAERPLALAWCWEALGDLDKARSHFLDGLQKKPGDVTVLKSVVNFQLRMGALPDAEPLLRLVVTGEVKAEPADVAWAKRGLALVLSSRNDIQQFTEALSLLGLTLDGQGKVSPKDKTMPSIEDQRVQAQVLATQPQRVLRAQAIALLEDLAKRQLLTPPDQYLLARLYEGTGALPKAREQLSSLVASQPGNPVYLAYYARSLLGQNELSTAQTYVDQLTALERKQGLERGAFGSVDLQAQLWDASGDHQKALDLMKEFTGRKNATPDDRFVLIAGLVRQQRFEEALAECEAAWKEKQSPPEKIGGASVMVLRVAHAKPEQCRRIQSLLEEARRQNPKAAALSLQLADLFDLQGDYASAETAYRQVLAQDPDNLVALNNLSWLLAQSTKGTEALDLINRAIQRAGERPELLDTRAVVEMERGQLREAIADLEKATADTRTPSRCFRLAEAYHRASQRDAALIAWKQALAGRLKPEQLHPMERVAFTKLSQELGVQ
jgi:tetratricopeptide (TPR) repeat protein